MRRGFPSTGPFFPDDLFGLPAQCLPDRSDFGRSELGFVGVTACILFIHCAHPSCRPIFDSLARSVVAIAYICPASFTSAVAVIQTSTTCRLWRSAGCDTAPEFQPGPAAVNVANVCISQLLRDPVADVHRQRLGLAPAIHPHRSRVPGQDAALQVLHGDGIVRHRAQPPPDGAARWLSAAPPSPASSR